jgi:tripartite-type tricarboxylate transporter receptor subunit TctC
MRYPRRQFLRLATGCIALPVVARIARAQTYPAKPVRIIVSVPPGGTFDIVARIVAQRLSERFGQQFIIENKPGAGTNLGTGMVAHADGDGYTLLLIGSPAAINATLYDNLDFDVERDLAPVAGVERMPLVLAVNPALPAKTGAQFIGDAKASPGKINMGSGGIGSTGHVAGELFNMMAGIKLAHVPYRGEAPALTDLLGGQVQVVFATAGSALNYVKTGTLRALGVTGAARLDVLPDVPAIAEFLPGYEATSWAGIAAPAKTPTEIVGKLNREINAAIIDPKINSQLTTLGATVAAGSPGEFSTFISDDIRKWAKVIKFANIRAS